MIAIYKHGLRIMILIFVSLAAFANTFSVFGQEPAWWTKQKRDCGLPSSLASLAYNSWDGKCPAKDARNNTGNNSDNGEQTRQVEEKRRADQKVAEETEQQRLAYEARAKKEAAERQKAFEKSRDETLMTLRGSGGNSGNTELRGVDSKGTELRGSRPDNGLRGSTPSSDPMVVDARNVPSSLPKVIENALPQTPAGDRVRKGFQAIAKHDWKLALAWFQDALNQEPGDPGLLRLVDLAKYTLMRQSRLKAAPNKERSTQTGTSNELPKAVAIYNRSHRFPKWAKPYKSAEEEAKDIEDFLKEPEPGHIWKQFFRLLTPAPKAKNWPDIYTGIRG